MALGGGHRRAYLWAYLVLVMHARPCGAGKVGPDAVEVSVVQGKEPGSVQVISHIEPPEGVSAARLESLLKSSPAFRKAVSDKLAEKLGDSLVSTGEVDVSGVSLSGPDSEGTPKPAIASTATRTPPAPPAEMSFWSRFGPVLATALLLAALCLACTTCLLLHDRAGGKAFNPAVALRDARPQKLVDSVWRFGRIVDAGRPSTARLDGSYDFELGNRMTDRRQLNLTVINEGQNEWRTPARVAREEHVSSGPGDWRNRPLGGEYAAIKNGEESESGGAPSGSGTLQAMSAVATQDDSSWRLGQRVVMAS